MKHKMRRFRQSLAEKDALEILANGTNGILSLVDADGEPYGVPISYAYDFDGNIYFHSAPKGHKIDCVNHDSRCSFCVVAQDLIVPEEFTTYFRSVIARGRIEILRDPAEITNGLLLLCEKYSPGIDSADEIARCLRSVRVLRLHIEELSGKESIELVRERLT